MPALLRKHPLIIVIGLLIVGLLVWGFLPQPVLVETLAVRRGPLTIAIEEEGRTRVIDRYVVSAPVSGVACRLQLDVGDPVQQGQVLLGITPLQSQVLDPRSRAQAEARVSAAESALRSAQETAAAAAEAEQLAGTELQRLRPLLDKQLVSADSFDRAATEARSRAAVRRSAEFNVEVARYELEAARTALQYSDSIDGGGPTERVLVRSPIDGRVLKVARECEGPVQTGEALVEVGDPKALEVEVDVLSADAVKIQPGMPVVFERWGGEQKLQGRVRVVEPVGFTKISALGVEEQRVLIISDFTSPAELWQRLGDGYRVEARFILWQQDDVLQVPASSLFRYNRSWALFVMENNRAVRRPVEIGQRNGLVAQVLEGVSEGEQVVNHPGDDIEQGTPIKLRYVN